MTARIATLGKSALAVIGLAVIALLIAETGTDVLARALLRAASWLPLIGLAELATIAADLISLRALHGARAAEIPGRDWARSALLSYAAAVFLPGGRATGELARGAILARHVGGARTAVAGTRLHAAHLWGTALFSIPCWLALDGDTTLGTAVAANGAWTAALGALFLFAPRIGGPVGAWLGQRVGALAGGGADLDRAVREQPVVPLFAIAGALISRGAQVAQSAILLFAIGGRWEADGALTSSAIQLVAASAGDLVPGQAGVIEGAYRVFAPSLGLAGGVADALAIALAIRVARVAIAAVGAATFAIWRAGPVAPQLAIAAIAHLALAPSTADAQRLVVHERLVVQLNPMGAEHMVAAGVRAPIGDPRDPLFAGAHIEAGVIDYTSPIDSINGGYLQLSPLAFLVLRAELSGIVQWPIGMDGAGFYPVDGYRADVRPANLPGARGGSASGWRLQLSTILQAAIPLGDLRLIAWCQIAGEHEQVGDAPFRFSARHDLVLARADWMVAISSMVLLEIPLTDRALLRVGAFDDARHVPRSGYTSNQLGPIVALALERLDPHVPELMVFARAAAYTDHATRTGAWTGLGGALIRYE
jgi:hypothetical protein